MVCLTRTRQSATIHRAKLSVLIVPVRRLRSGKPLTQNAALEKPALTREPRRTSTRQFLSKSAEEEVAEEDDEVGDEDGSDQESDDADEGSNNGEDEDGRVDFDKRKSQTSNSAKGHETDKGEEDVGGKALRSAALYEFIESEDEEQDESNDETEPTAKSSAKSTSKRLQGNLQRARDQLSPDLGSKVMRPRKRGRKQNPTPRKRARKTVEEEAEEEEKGEREEEELEQEASGAEDDDQGEESESEGKMGESKVEQPDLSDEEQDITQLGQAGDDSEGEGQDGDEHDETYFIDPPDDLKEPTVIRLKTNILKKLLSQMKLRGWVYEHEWVKILLMEKDEDQKGWLRRQKHVVKTDKCGKLMKQLIKLWIICHEMPKAPQLEEQFKYLREKKDALSKCMSTIHPIVQAIAGDIEAQKKLPRGDKSPQRKEAQALVRDLYRRVIPMLAILVKEAFMLGGASGPKRDREPLEESTLVASTFQILLRVKGWMRRLYTWMEFDLTVHPLTPVTNTEYEKKNLQIAKTQRERLAAPIERLHLLVKKAYNELLRQLEQPRTQAKAIEKDDALLREREKKEEERIKAQGRQMQLFIESTQRMRNGIRASGSRFSAIHPPGSRLATRRSLESQPASRRPTTSQAHVDDEYYQKHGGWYYKEDDLLLKMIRKVLKPDLKVLAGMLPDRSLGEVEQRVGALKDRVRARYVEAQVDPPLWCYHHE